MMREEFEKWAEKPPYEFNLERFGENGSWPGNYRSYPVQCAWVAYQAAYLSGAKAMQEEAAKVGEKLAALIPRNGQFHATQIEALLDASEVIRAINPESL